ncbi:MULTISPECIES: acyl carrier protein [Herbaspirillum]|uniref:Acyl carrier protein n=1 Tax=Herbaspirillum seropedicae (strain SmR1) TaxID=757424 RepID=D8IUE6_HERSS|nr:MULTISPECIES: phosphopantetheine-binding protein [Herbaspirillum]ADJ65678.1 acyl carrier protein [Herbaspirillum seropedicae SmR1]AKN67492.1 hypothetical protein ACP92_21025 [Herbaspirillum seropedicae]NQE32081.1 hypothetical protein [Herbaspirillum seropedicae]UMU23501.1 hypothetical protein G5B88_21350 [Herbaspirillum seropedicae]
MVTTETIINIIKESGLAQDISAFDPEKTFKQNGIDSLDVFTVLLTIEEQLNVKFSEQESNEIRSAADIVKLINSR